MKGAMSAFGPKQTCRKAQSMSLLGVKRTCSFAPQMSAYDPKRTFQSIASDARAAKHVRTLVKRPSHLVDYIALCRRAVALAKPAAGASRKVPLFFRTGI
jgi:hypothetical protein